MPLTVFQKRVCQALATQRSERSHVAGGAAINREDASPRFSNDLDIFHDSVEAVAAAAMADEQALTAAGFQVQWDVRDSGFYRALVSGPDDSIRLDWCSDSAFRFFPVQPDPLLGYRLHECDLATNKLLALASRREIRDYVDVLFLHRTQLSLGAMAWAACGKDQGYSPDSLLAQAKRNVSYRQNELDPRTLREPLDLAELKRQWIDAVDRAEDLIRQLPPEDVGCIYVDEVGRAVTPMPADAKFVGLRRQFGSIGGSWPR